MCLILALPRFSVCKVGIIASSCLSVIKTLKDGEIFPKYINGGYINTLDSEKVSWAGKAEVMSNWRWDVERGKVVQGLEGLVITLYAVLCLEGRILAFTDLYSELFSRLFYLRLHILTFVQFHICQREILQFSFTFCLKLCMFVNAWDYPSINYYGSSSSRWGCQAPSCNDNRFINTSILSEEQI